MRSSILSVKFPRWNSVLHSMYHHYPKHTKLGFVYTQNYFQYNKFKRDEISMQCLKI